LDHTIFGEPSNEEDRVVIADDVYSLDDLALKVGNKFEYVYDFGDDWVHSIRVKSREKLDGENTWALPCVCIDGARAAPPKTAEALKDTKQCSRN